MSLAIKIIKWQEDIKRIRKPYPTENIISPYKWRVWKGGWRKLVHINSYHVKETFGQKHESE